MSTGCLQGSWLGPVFVTEVIHAAISGSTDVGRIRCLDLMAVV
jgi:hypothetical protein